MKTTHWAWHCVDCFNCKQKTFRSIKEVQDFLHQKEARVRKNWEAQLSKNGFIEFYWCSIEFPPKLRRNPPGFGKAKPAKQCCPLIYRLTWENIMKNARIYNGPIVATEPDKDSWNNIFLTTDEESFQNFFNIVQCLVNKRGAEGRTAFSRELRLMLTERHPLVNSLLEQKALWLVINAAMEIGVDNIAQQIMAQMAQQEMLRVKDLLNGEKTGGGHVNEPDIIDSLADDSDFGSEPSPTIQ